MSQTGQVDLESLFQTAVSEGSLSAESLNLANLDELGAQINGALGTDPTKVKASEVVLATLLIDDSGSIRVGGNSQVVRDGYNEVIKALLGAKQGDGIQICTVYLNGDILNGYVPVAQAPLMTPQNYNPQGGTPLYDQAIATLLTVAAKAQQFSDAGIPVRTVTLFVTDGADVHSAKKATDVKTIATDLLRQENHIIAGMGIDDGSTDFREVFKDMGLPDEWILTPGNSQSEIRRAFAMFSQSAVRASQNAASFSKTAGGGFAA